jgi:NAD(P) transhydrogenase subunit alpha
VAGVPHRAGLFRFSLSSPFISGDTQAGTVQLFQLFDTHTVKIAVLTEKRAGERRVALVPDVVKKLVGTGWQVAIQSGAGSEAAFSDAAYAAAGATVTPDAASTYEGAGLVVGVNALTPEQSALVPRGAVVLSFFPTAQSADTVRALADRGVTLFSFDELPRISRAQGMDALSSQATVSGYRAGLTAAEHLAKFFPMFMTAAGTVPPAKVLVMGVGVAGLQAIATARRLGAVVKAYDVRAAAKEEAESLGATFLDIGVVAEGAGGYARELSDEELARQRAALAAEVARSDVIIATAAVPGRVAPVLLTRAMVEGMSEGAVVVDMAADWGGNCELTQAGVVVDHGGVHIVGMANPPSGMPTHASFLFARNVANVLGLIGPEGTFAPDWDDEIVDGMCVLREGKPHSPGARALLDPLDAGGGDPR